MAGEWSVRWSSALVCLRVCLVARVPYQNKVMWVWQCSESNARGRAMYSAVCRMLSPPLTYWRVCEREFWLKQPVGFEALLLKLVVATCHVATHTECTVTVNAVANSIVCGRMFFHLFDGMRSWDVSSDDICHQIHAG